jgi:hypothetical protein
MLTVVQAKVFSCKCDKCGYEWKSFARPARCAKCKAPGWNKNSPAHNNDVVREDPPASSQVVKEDPLENLRAPIAVQSPAKERPAARDKKPWKEVKAPAPGKKKLCPHGFAVVSGITACVRCN